MKRIFFALFLITAFFLACAGEDNNDDDSGESDQSDDDNDNDDNNDDNDASPPLAYAFPAGFLWGSASSAYQTEGGNAHSDYTQWLLKRYGEDRCGMADNSYNLYETDADLAAQLGSQMYRLGIEWARIEPARDQIDQDEIAHYRLVLQALVERGIRPMVTLHHFTNPQWIQDQGAWLNPDTVEQFVEFAALMASEFGDLVDYWLTINEPMIYTTGTYLIWVYPGGTLNNMNKTMQATVHMIQAHARAYRAINEADLGDADGDGEAALVSLAQVLFPTSPLRPDNANDIESARMYDYLMNRLFLCAVVFGMLDANGDGDTDDATTDPAEGYHAELAGTLDFLGFNYYNPVQVLHFPFVFGTVQGVPCFPQADFICHPGGREPYVQGDNGNPIVPSGIYDLIADFQDEFQLPLLITENGLATTDGYKRSWFILEHLKYVHTAIQDGYEVLGYLHWSLLDNFEWLDAFTMRFGLFSVDYSTFERSWTEGAETYSTLVHANGISQELVDAYAEPPAAE
ncbi:MAG: glycoside hydrolase family 1 protein [Myxococcales bacterium]|nr:glycoside hydrolase family 1 protein [Myxococcales bacterium]